MKYNNHDRLEQDGLEVDEQFLFAGIRGQEVDPDHVLTVKCISIAGKVTMHDSKTDQLFYVSYYEAASLVGDVWIEKEGYEP